jgi:hypothetical protein
VFYVIVAGAMFAVSHALDGSTHCASAHVGFSNLKIYKNSMKNVALLVNVQDLEVTSFAAVNYGAPLIMLSNGVLLKNKENESDILYVITNSDMFKFTI